jgi:hypothetical protein
VTAGPHDLRTAAGRADAAMEVARALMPGHTPLQAEVRRWPGQWVLLVEVGGEVAARPLVGVAVDAHRADKLPDGSLVTYAEALGEAWRALCAPKRGVA